MAATKPPPLPLTVPTLKFSPSRFSDLISPHQHVVPLPHRQPVSTHAHLPCPVPAPADERILCPDTLEPVLTAPLSPDSSSQPHERRQRCDTNKAHSCPVSNPQGKSMRARKVGALTSSFVLDQPTRPNAAQGQVLKPLSELRCSVMVSDCLGGSVVPGGDEQRKSSLDSEDEHEHLNQAKRRRRHS